MVKNDIHISKQTLKLKHFSLFLIILIFCISCSQKKQKKLSDNTSNKDGLTRLLEGNERFLSYHPIHPDQTLDKLRELEKGQHPFAVVISCSDSRVPPELIFDQGFGDIFIIRNAGNIIGDYEIGSVEYAVEHLQTRLVLVVGHSNCGAISAYLEHQHDSIPNHIQKIIDHIKIEDEELALNKKSPTLYNDAIKANVLHGVHLLKESMPVLKKYREKSKITIVGALYDMHSGKVNIISE